MLSSVHDISPSSSSSSYSLLLLLPPSLFLWSSSDFSSNSLSKSSILSVKSMSSTSYIIPPLFPIHCHLFLSIIQQKIAKYFISAFTTAMYLLSLIANKNDCIQGFGMQSSLGVRLTCLDCIYLLIYCVSDVTLLIFYDFLSTRGAGMWDISNRNVYPPCRYVGLKGLNIFPNIY